MCDKCNYTELLESTGLEATANRVHVLEVIGGNNYPLTATEVFQTVTRTKPINRVTVYRILDLLVDHRVIERINAGGRAAHYGMAPNKHHAPHPHFYCTNCGLIDCLKPGSLVIDSEPLQKTFPARLTELRLGWRAFAKIALNKSFCLLPQTLFRRMPGVTAVSDAPENVEINRKSIFSLVIP